MGRKQAQAFLAALICWPVAAQTYDPATIPPQIIGSPQTMTALNGGDDSTRLVQLGFPFEYYGQVYTSAWVSSNGFVSFQGGNHLCCNGSEMVNAQRNTIYGLWSDLISGGSPYYRTDGNMALFGWYNTNEYGTNLSNTFEIALYADGKIQWNYGDVNNQYHIVSAGLTGPTMEQSISLFYGQNVNLLDNTSYVTGASAPEPEPDPIFIPIPVVNPGVPSAEPVVVSSGYAELDTDVVVNTTMATETAPEEVQEEVEPSETEVALEVAEEIALEEAEVVEEVSQERDVERLSPDEVAKLAAGGTADGSGNGELSQSEINQAVSAVAEQASQAEDARLQQQSAQGDPTIAENASEGLQQGIKQVSMGDVARAALSEYTYNLDNGPLTTTEAAGSANIFVANPITETAMSTSVDNRQADVGQTQSTTLELLNMAMSQNDMSQGEPQDIGDMNTGDAEAMVQLAVLPAGYSAYTQARIPDIQFYQPRSIYTRRRIPDQNMALYRLMNSQDLRWQDMVGGQYE